MIVQFVAFLGAYRDPVTLNLSKACDESEPAWIRL